MYNKYDINTDTITYKGQVIKDFFKAFPQQPYIKKYVKDNLMLLMVGGSHAYGMATEDSDIDIRGIFKDNIDQILGFDKIEQLSNDSSDLVIYSFTKALHLIAEQNPNMHELLWADENDILYATDDYWYLRSRRWELLSKLSRHKYSGYAISQLKRLKGHSKWLVKEQEGKFNNKPNIKDYIIKVNSFDGVVNKYSETYDMQALDSYLFYTKVKDEIYNVWYDKYSNNYSLIENGNSFIPIQEYAPDIYASVDNEERYCYQGIIWFNKSQFQKDLEEYNNWKKWKENRNEKRHELEEKFGYDTKHASHTFRLLNTGIEILNGEEVKVKRPDADFLLDIRNGKYSYEWIISEAEKLDKVVLGEAYKNSKLQNSVDKRVVVDIIKHILKLEN